MDTYQRRPPGATPDHSTKDTLDTLNDASGFLRRLIPLPDSATMSPLSMLRWPAQRDSLPSNPAAGAIPEEAISQQAESIVSQAASILDEEMARGVLAARHAAPGLPQGPLDGSHPLQRQLHDLVDNAAAIWPGLQGMVARPVASQPAGSPTDPLAELTPRATVRAGQRATIAMTLRNSESRPVRLVAAVTDLLGSRGGRIASALLELTPGEVCLEPREQQDLAIATTVPAGILPGCYSGLLVVTGVDYLRALITIEVV